MAVHEFLEVFHIFYVKVGIHAQVLTGNLDIIPMSSMAVFMAAWRFDDVFRREMRHFSRSSRSSGVERHFSNPSARSGHTLVDFLQLASETTTTLNRNRDAHVGEFIHVNPLHERT